MGALVASGWVSPGQPLRSFFLTRILQNGGPMHGVFSEAEVTVVSDWIQAGAKISGERSLVFAADAELVAADTDAARKKAQREFAAKRPLIGMGSVH